MELLVELKCKVLINHEYGHFPHYMFLSNPLRVGT